MHEPTERAVRITATESQVRKMLSTLHAASAWVLLFGMIGMCVELVLLRHVDGAWQLAPLLLLAAGTLQLGWYVFDKRIVVVRALQGMMWLFVLSGVVGAWLHLKGNVIYESESNPGLAGRELYQAAVQGSTPTLAPGAMIQLGLAGLLMVYCGRLLRDSRLESGSHSTGEITR